MEKKPLFILHQLPPMHLVCGDERMNIQTKQWMDYVLFFGPYLFATNGHVIVRYHFDQGLEENRLLHKKMMHKEWWKALYKESLHRTPSPYTLPMISMGDGCLEVKTKGDETTTERVVIFPLEDFIEPFPYYDAIMKEANQKAEPIKGNSLPLMVNFRYLSIISEVFGAAHNDNVVTEIRNQKAGIIMYPLSSVVGERVEGTMALLKPKFPPVSLENNTNYFRHTFWGDHLADICEKYNPTQP
jgi:hypothetical protein